MSDIAQNREFPDLEFETPVPEAPVEEPATDKEDLACKYPGCDFVAKNQSGKTLHYNSTHGAKPRKKKAKVVKATNIVPYSKAPSKETTKDLKEVYYDGDSRVLLEDRDGEWWCAMPLDVV